MRWVFDLDGTICFTKYKIEGSKWSYIDAEPNRPLIEKINILYDMGENIVLFTARGSMIKNNWEEITTKQLKEWGVKYHELRFGKPGAEIYVDDRTIPPEELINKWNFYQGLVRAPR